MNNSPSPQILRVALLAGLAVFVLFGRAFAEESTSKPRAVLPRKHFRVFQRYCLDCHDSESKKGGIDLEKIPFELSKDIPTADLWAKVLNAINSGEMPPKRKKQISAAEKIAFLEDLSTQMVTARRILSDSGGVIALRRLNRREYRNTVEELVGVRPDVSTLPDDQANSGFDTSGASLFFSSDQLEQYLALARRTLELAIQPVDQPKRVVRIEPEEKYTEEYAGKLAEGRDKLARARAFLAQSGKPATEFGFVDAGQAKKQARGGGKFLPQLEAYLERPETKHGATLISRIKGGITKVSTRAMDGGRGKTLLLRVRTAAYPGVTPRYHYLEFSMRSWSHGYTTQIGWRKVSGTIEKPQLIEFRVSVPAGERVQFSVHQRTHQGRGDKKLWTVHQKKNPIGTPPGLWVDWLEVVPGRSEGLSAAASRIFFDRPEGWNDRRYALEVIRRFAVRAFRAREPAPEYLGKLLERFAAKRKAGLRFREALIEPLSIVLSSPSFLYMVESSGGDESLTDLELAVRLSYFLWSAPPDQELLSVARERRLSDPEVLRKQTSRLLADGKVDRFVRGFVHQWLHLERLGMFQFEATLYPTFDNGARENAREEVYQTVHAMLRERLPLGTLLKADFVIVNDLLADYYGLDGVEGHEFRKVSLPTGSPRGGLLGSAAVLAMGSDGLRTSPVERGAWVLRYLLNDPPAPAPANVPQISRLEGKVLSSRQLQQAHQEEPQCAQCHRKIDPIGFGLENFDAVGKWRDIEIVVKGARKRSRSHEFSIEPAGQLPNGAKFSDFRSLRDAVAQQSDAFARGFAESLIAYGLGRPYGFTDRELADAMLKNASEHDYELSCFVHALVQSKKFRSK
ncbi:MAG: DUF1592 domain-containing protein [Planctomycetota bacterium]